jgi:hypothetical protein
MSGPVIALQPSLISGFEDLGITCSCGRFVEYKPCSSNARGNRGRPVAVVS